MELSGGPAWQRLEFEVGPFGSNPMSCGDFHQMTILLGFFVYFSSPKLVYTEDEPLSDLFYQPKFPGPCDDRGFSYGNLFFFSPIDEHLGCFYSWAVTNNAAETTLELVPQATHIQAYLSSFYPGVESVSHRACVQLYPILSNRFTSGCADVRFHQQGLAGPLVPRPRQDWGRPAFLTGRSVRITKNFTCISLIINEVASIYSYFHWPFEHYLS